jgi:hypothetical protein
MARADATLRPDILTVRYDPGDLSSWIPRATTGTRFDRSQPAVREVGDGGQMIKDQGETA